MLARSPTMEDTDVIICGGGPTGTMLSAYLGRLGVRNICLDREHDITTDPRGIALDEDGIRAVQGLGLYDKIFTEIGQCMGVFQFVSGTQTNLQRPPFMSMDYTTSEGGTGHVGFICHKQPVLEKHLRLALQASPNAQLRTSCTLTNISEDDRHVYVEYEDIDLTKRHARAKFLVGADGKTGFTRKKYLEPKGVLMQQASKSLYKEAWVAVNWKMTLPNPNTHPDLPFWSLNYSPEQVYDLFFPQDFRFLCNPQRAAVCGHFGRPEDRLWRFEFVVLPGEDGTEIATPQKLKEIVFPYITRDGGEFGASGPISYPADCIETLRSRAFEFTARSCNVWSLGRVSLCGDAAHVFPPFGGQGIASGFRDACGLAWRLRIACRGENQHFEATFQAWYNERKQQLEKSLSATVENGKHVTEANPLWILVRDTYFGLIQVIPSWKRWLEQGARRDGMVRYKFQPGMHFLAEFAGGGLFPQVYCASLAEETPIIQFTDDVIFRPDKQGLLQLVVVLASLEELSEARAALQKIGDLAVLSAGYLSTSETSFFLESPLAPRIADSHSVFRMASAAEFAESPLCINRPVPKYYDERRMSKEMGEMRYAILRPDRFVFAVCSDAQQLIRALESIGGVLDER